MKVDETCPPGALSFEIGLQTLQTISNIVIKHGKHSLEIFM
jgi:hypothetical protein